MLDMAGRLGDFLIICHKGTSKVALEEKAKPMVESGTATIGICAWQTGEKN